MYFREKNRRKPQDVGLGNLVLDLTLKAPFIKRKTDELRINIKNFCSAKDPVKRIEKQGTGWEKIFAYDTSNKAQVFRMYKEVSKINNKEKKKPS